VEFISTVHRLSQFYVILCVESPFCRVLTGKQGCNSLTWFTATTDDAQLYLEKKLFNNTQLSKLL